MAVNTILNPDRRQGSGFTNLQRVMNANQGNRLGQTVGQGIQKAGEQTRQGLNEAQNQFKTQSEQGRLDTDENKSRVSNVLNDAGNATEQDINQFAKFRAGQYSGPQNLQNIENLKGQAQEAQGLGQAAGSQSGRTGLLQRFAAAPGAYGSGQQKLDTLLLGATGSNPLKEARRSVSGINQQVSGAGDTASNVAQQYTNLAKGFGQDVTQRTTGLETEAQTAAETKASEANKSDAALRDLVEKQRQSAASNQLSQKAIEGLGLSAGQRTYGANLGQFLSYKGRDALNAARPEEVMSQQEFQRFGNLRKLMGSDLNGYDATKAGTYQAGQEAYDKDAAQAAITAAHQNVAPAEGEQAHAQQIWDAWEEARRQGNTPQALMAATNKIRTFAPGALGGKSFGENARWAQNNLASANARLADKNAQYAGNVGLLPEDQG